MRHTEPRDAVRITLAKSGKHIELIIEDAGPGLPAGAYREDIRSLNRFDKSRSRENGGSGLGMSIMSAVIEKLDGKFSLRKSELGGLVDSCRTTDRLNLVAGGNQASNGGSSDAEHNDAQALSNCDLGDMNSRNFMPAHCM